MENHKPKSEGEEIMGNGNVLFKIDVLDNGEFRVFDENGKEFRKLDPSQVGETFLKKEIKAVKYVPAITYLEANPRWVNILGTWYYM